MGLGHVGLPTAVLLADSGIRVLGVDIDPVRRSAVVRGEVGTEPGLAARLAGCDPALEVAAEPVRCPAYIVAVPTPLAADGGADLGALRAAMAAVAAVAPDGAVVVIESTVPVGTTAALAQDHPRLHLAACPERVLPGDALRELVRNDRVLGGTPAATEAAAAVLGRFVRGVLVRTTSAAAELCKLTENAARDVQLAFAHTAAALARAHGVDPWTLQELVNRHPRVELLTPGIGVGGHCLPVDPWFLTAGADAPLVRAARNVNDAVPPAVVARLRAQIPSGEPVALLGLAYKPGVADLRNAPAVRIAWALAETHDVVVTDPASGAPAGLTAVSLAVARRRKVWVLLVAHDIYCALRPPADVLAIDVCGGWRS